MSLINVGSEANDGTGDPLRTAFQKLNANVPRFYFESVGISIEQDSALTYASGQMHSVSEGDILWTQDGFRFSVLASAAEEWDRLTESGVKLQAEADTNGAHSILQFGADTSQPNNAPFIQKALDRSYVYHLTGPVGEFEITEPLWIKRDSTTFTGPTSVGGAIGAGNRSLRIKKTTSTEIDFKGTMVNAAIVMGRTGSGYIAHVTLENLHILADHSTVEYGLYVPVSALHRYSSIGITGFRIGYFTNDSWLHNWQSVRVDCRTISADAATAGIGTQQGWTETTIGIRWDGAGSGAGPGNSFTSVWVRNAHIGWSIQGMGYGALNACGADQMSVTAYDLNSSILTLNGCGMENSYCGGDLIQVIGSQCHITINNFKSDGRCQGNLNSESLTAKVRAGTSAKLIMNGVRLSDFENPRNSYNILIRGGSHVITNNSRMPTNGNADPLYQSGGTWVDTTNGVTEWRNANGTNTQGPPAS